MASPSPEVELDVFKTSINLTEYAAACGYELDKSASGRSSVVMRHGDGDKVVIARDVDNHWAISRFEIQETTAASSTSSNAGNAQASARFVKSFERGPVSSTCRATSTTRAPGRGLRTHPCLAALPGLGSIPTGCSSLRRCSPLDGPVRSPGASLYACRGTEGLLQPRRSQAF